MPLTRANSLENIDPGNNSDLAKLSNDPDILKLIQKKLGSKSNIDTGPSKLNELIDLTKQKIEGEKESEYWSTTDGQELVKEDENGPDAMSDSENETLGETEKKR